MKAIAIVELPDDAFDDDTEWIIDDEGAIRYLEDNAWMHYKNLDADGIELKPLPEKRKLSPKPHSMAQNLWNQGWNVCLEEITRNYLKLLEIGEEE